MNRRLIPVFASGCFGFVTIWLGTRYLTSQNRYKTSDEFRTEQEESFRAREREEALVELARMRSHAKTDDDKFRVACRERTFDSGKINAEIERFSISDGVDRFEAWLLARTYFMRVFGVCGDVDLPQKDGGRWKIPVGIGYPPRAGIIYVDATTGAITCEGQATIPDAKIYLREALTNKEAVSANR